MSQNYGLPTWPDRFSPKIAQQLVDKVPGLNADRVFSSAFTDEIHLQLPPADRFITLFMPDFPVDQPGVSGGGIYTTGFDATLEANIFVRLEADIEARSGRLLEEVSFGVYEFVRQVLAALQMWPGPVDADAATGLSYFKRPMRLRRFQIHKKGGIQSSRWAIAATNWEVAFVGDLDKNYTGVIL